MRMSGSGCRSSQTTKPTSMANDTAKKPSVVPASQPSWPALVIAYTSNESPPVTSTAPGTSNALTFASRLSLSRIGARMNAGHADGDVDEEDPLPAESVREDAAEQNARGCAEAADRAPDAECDVPLAAFGERRREDRQGRRRR